MNKAMGCAVIAALGLIGLAGCGTSADNTKSTAGAGTSTATATATKSKPAAETFGSGDYQVPQDMKPGTYRTRAASPSCYWQTSRDLSGNIGSIIANDNTDGPAVVTIPPAARGFSTQNCGDWSTDLSRITASKTTFGDGTYIVKTDIAPGVYRSAGGGGCYWARLSGFIGGTTGIIANNNTDGRAIVQIASTDKGFTSTRCGTWTKR